MFLSLPTLYIAIEEAPPTVQTPSKGLYASELTILCSHSTWWGKVGQLYCITPRICHRPPMNTGIIFPDREQLALPPHVILSYI